jgi:uncharacterized delta-60 repeat protein
MPRSLPLAAACAAALALAVPAAAVAGGAPATPADAAAGRDGGRAAPPRAALDAGFGGDGVAELPASGMDGAMDVAATPDGGAVVVGFDWAGGRHWVLKLAGDGRPDGGFGGGDGVAEVVHPDAPAGGGDSDVAWKVAVDAAGRIVVLGDWGPFGTRALAIARLLPDGALDPSFDGDGRKLIVLDADARFSSPDALALAPDGSITIVGAWRGRTQPIGEPARTTVLTLASDGSLLRLPSLLFQISTGRVHAVAAAADGRLAFAGATLDDVLLLMRTRAFLPLPGVEDHRTTFPNADGENSLDAVAHVPGGGVVAVGTVLDDTTADYTFSGLLTTFAADGAVAHRRIHGLDDGHLTLHALGTDGGALLAGGYTGYRNHHNQPAVVALAADGSLDAARGGVQEIALPESLGAPVDTGALAFDGDGHGVQIVRWADAGGIWRTGVARFDASPPGPGDPGEPRDPGDPGDPTDPGDPSEPTDPGDPRDPGHPSDPGGPGPHGDRPPADRPHPQTRGPLAPRARFTAPGPRAAGGAVRSLRGTAAADAARVEVALVRRLPGTRRCSALRSTAPRFAPARGCAATRWLSVRPRGGVWRLRLRAPLPAGRYRAWVRATPTAGTTARPFSARAGNAMAFAVRRR